MTENAERHARMVFCLNRFYGMPQEKIAEEVGVSFSTLSGWLRKGTKPQARARAQVERVFETAVGASASPGEVARSVVSVLQLRHGAPRLGNKDDPLDELFFILLSLKTSHLTYEDTYNSFKARFHPWKKLLGADVEDVEEHIRRGGLGSIKAKAFIDIAAKLQAEFGKVTLAPLKKMELAEAEKFLTDLPGVGLKTARCVMMYSLGADVTPVDTHTYRVGVRIGIVPTCRNPDDAHAHFDKVVSKGLAYALHTNFVAHGREFCTDTKPRCGECPVNRLCKAAAHQREEAPKAVEAAKRPKKKASDPFTAADIYAGCGGLSAGLRDAGFNVAYAIDWDKHACKTHEENFPESVVDCADVRKIKGERVLQAAGGSVDLLAGGPNCQGVSQRGLRSPDDPRNFMFPEFMRLVQEVGPRMVLMENVPGLAHRHNYGILRAIFESFHELGYRCAADVLLAADYGVPQLRYRFVLIATRGTEELTLPMQTHAPDESLWQRKYLTLGEALGDLPHDPAPSAGKTVAYSQGAETAFQKYVRDGSRSVHNHTASATEKVNLDRIMHVPEGGNWKDIPGDLLPPRFFECRLTDHSTTYARPRRDSPSFTVTSLFGNITAGAFTHPVRNRAFTVREGARLQSFKDTFRFVGPSNSQYRQIGNAVPPLLGLAVGRHLKSILAGGRPEGRVPRITWERLADPKAWDALPVLTPRFKALFGQGTRWPKGWGAEPKDWKSVLDGNYKLRLSLRPTPKARVASA